MLNFFMLSISGVVRVTQPSLLMTELNFDLNISVTDGVFTSFAKLHVSVKWFKVQPNVLLFFEHQSNIKNYSTIQIQF